MRAGVAATVLYALAAVALTWPLTLQLTSHLGALQGVGDPFLNLWILGWDLQAWTSDPLGVLTGRAFDAPIFHPARLTLTYSDHQLLQALVMVPVYLVTGNVVLCYNLLVVLSIAASGLAMHALARSLTGSTAAAIVAGLAWACWPYRTAHLLHLQLQALYFLPLALWALHRVAAGRRTGAAVALGVAAGLQAVASVYYGVMTAVVLVLSSTTLAISSGQWRQRRYWSRVLLGALVAALLVLPIGVLYLRGQQAGGFGRNLYEAANHAATLQSYTQVPPSNLLYGRTGLLAPRAAVAGERDRRHVEHQMFPGLVVLGLALLGLGRGWRSDARPAVVTAAALVGTGVVLSLGPEGARGLYGWLAANVVGFDAIRAPARFAVVAMLGLCTLAAFGTRYFLAARAARPARRHGSVAGAFPWAPLIVALMMGEYLNTPLAFVPAPPATTAVGQWLRHEPLPGAVAYIPVSHDVENTPFMVAALEHGRPIVNGYSGQRPPFYSAVVEALAGLPDAAALLMLKDLEVRFVVSPTAIAGANVPQSPLVERVALAEGVIYELRWTPESEAAAVVAPSVPPPPPGPIPFRVGERATYSVQWVGGPVDLPAGSAVLEVGGGADAGSGRPGLAVTPWVFSAQVETADWVSRFFEARYQLTTHATAALLPHRHERVMAEASKAPVTRAYDYAAGDGLLHQPSADGVDNGPATPLVQDARDALSALYYVRTLPLATGDRVSLPVNDAGRNMTLSLTVEAREVLHTPMGARPAVRLVPTLTRRLERRQPIRATIWVGDDDRRVPLVVDIEAGFGRVRIELVDYRP